ncbi:MAG: LemA family protein [Gallionellaceae bacterium]|jgi:LemA protein
MTSTLIFFGIASVALIYIISLYNNLVQLKHGVAKAWANIDVLLKQRHDELPKLVEVCRQYTQFEQETLQRVIAARSQVQAAREGQDIGALGKAEGMLRMGLGNIFAVAEAYPELKANQHFMQLQTRITGLENGIADRRELYNESVNIYNVGIEQFPALLVANMFNFNDKPLLEFASAEKADVDMQKLFKGRPE